MTKKRILFVDDEPNVLRSYERTLHEYRDRWAMQFCDCPFEAWDLLNHNNFDTVISDIRMPGMTGLQLLGQMKSSPELSDVPVIIVTGEADRNLKRKALDMDASDLLSKPVESDELVARIRSSLRHKEFEDRLKRQNEELEHRVRERTAELVSSRIDIIWRLGKAAEFRDEDTGNHVIRVGSYARIVASALALEKEYTDTLFFAAPLHDIGKIGVPDAILLKPGKLSDTEWKTMRRHCEFGVSILSDECKFMQVAAKHSGDGLTKSVHCGENAVIKMATTIAATHHEKWDGSGYPYGLAKTEIPLEGRIVAIADVYDALRSERPYKKAFSREKSLSILEQGSGIHFDPQVFDAFAQNFDQIKSIEDEFRDTTENAPILPTIMSELSLSAVAN